MTAIPVPAELEPYAGRWQIAAYPGGLDVYSAEQRPGDGRSMRYIVARTPAELAAKLAEAEAEVS
jgi:hypothetical protein